MGKYWLKRREKAKCSKVVTAKYPRLSLGTGMLSFVSLFRKRRYGGF